MLLITSIENKSYHSVIYKFHKQTYKKIHIGYEYHCFNWYTLTQKYQFQQKISCSLREFTSF